MAESAEKNQKNLQRDEKHISSHFLMTNEDAGMVAHALVQWHGAHQRALPWRAQPAGRRDPYQVWIAEAMLQQTRVAVVEGYYQRWMERLPTLASLAGADLDTVLKLWEGLGYYARARNLHRAAQIVVAEHDGALPRNPDALLALPGVGRYTAGAILSLAWGDAAPILDGNVKRVLARLGDLPLPIEEPAAERALWEEATRLVLAAPPNQAGTLNEAIMELGAILCTPQSPRCMICPVASHCRALAAGSVAQRPVRKARKSTPHYDVAAGVIWQGDPYGSKVLIAQRPAEGLLGGLWEFPGGKREASDADLPATLRREISEELDFAIDVLDLLTTVQHAFTHFRITLHAFHARYVAGEPKAIGCAAWRWVEVAELGDYAMGKVDRVVTARLVEGYLNDT